MQPRTPEHSVLNSGEYHERDAFGLPLVDRNKYNTLYKQMTDKRGESAAIQTHGVSYLPRREAMNLIVETALPLKPKQPFIASLREKIVQQLGIEDAKDVRVFSAVKTPLDIFHGTDAFVRYTPPDGAPIDVTLDISLKGAKEEYKADVVLTTVEVDPQHNRRQFEQSVTFAAEEVTARIKRELETREQRARSTDSWRRRAA